MSESSADRNVVEVLAEEFVERYRQGERPPLSEYTQRYPDIADQIEDLFPALLMMENLKPAEEDEAAARERQLSAAALDHIGDYRIIREVGRGGMGIVYEAEQVSLGRHVALKVLPKSLLETPKHRMRFEREAKAAAKLHHTNIVPVFGVGQQDDVGYYVMQFIQGLALDEVLDELKRMKVRPDSSGGSLQTGELRISRRDVSAADVARSLMTGTFRPPTEAARNAGNGQAGGDETVVAPPANPAPVDGAPGSAGAAPSVDARRAASASKSNGRLSDSFSLSDSSVVLPGGAKSRADKSSKKHTYWESVARIGVQVADALEYAHGQGILHRDIKPSNLLLDVQGVVWVTDFGLAKLDDDRGLTETGDVLGTLRYMAPETFKGLADARSELYSLGLTLYELLAFRPAFGETNRKTLIDQVLNAEVAPLGKLNPDIPRDLVTIVHKAIERDPGHRYQTAQELADDLQRFVDDEPIKARRVSAIERVARWSRRNRGMAAALAAVCLLLLVINIAGPIVTWWTMSLNQQLEAKQGELSETITQLRKEEKRANKKAEDAEAARKDAVRLGAEAQKQEKEAQQQKSFARRNLYTSSLLAAQLSLTRPDGYSRAKELLAELRPQANEADMRGWEWYYLDAQRPTGQLVVQSFTGYPIPVVFSPDGKLLAVGDSSGEIKLFAADSGRLLQTLPKQQAAVWSLAWRADGARLASAGADHSVRIWNLETGSEQLTLLGHRHEARAVAWSPDGKRLVTGGLDGLVKTWDAASGKNLLTINHPGEIRGVDWSSDGSRLVSGSGDGTVRLWDAESGEAIHVMRGHKGRISRVRFSPDGRRIASAAWERPEKTVIIWDAEQGKELLTLKDPASNIYGVRWSPDGSKLATAAWSGMTADIWDANTGEKLHSFAGHQKYLYDASWTPDGRRLATSSNDNTVRFWEVVKEKPAPEIAGHSASISTLAWSRDGSRIATAGSDKTVKIWDVATRQNLLTFDRHRNPVHCVDWNLAGTQLASCGREQVFHIWEAETGEVLHTINASAGGDVKAVAWSPDGTQIATAASDKTVRIFDAATEDEIQQFYLNEGALSVDWSRDGRRLAASSSSGELKVWNAATGREVASFHKHDQTLWAVRFSPDGGKLAAGGELKPQESIFGDAGGSGGEGTLTVWDLDTDQPPRQFRGHTSTVRSIDWMEDGRLLSAGRDGKAILWDVAGGGQLLTLDDPDGQAIVSARFDPAELQIATAGDAPGIRLWDATGSYAAELSLKLLPVLDERIARNPTVDDLMLRGRIHSADGELDEAAADFLQAAALRGPDDKSPAWIETSWWVAGPYPEPLGERQPPETQLDPNRPIPAENGAGLEPRYWQREQLSSSQGLNLGRIFAGAQHISAYAMTRVYSPERQSAGLLLGADDRAQVWLNGTIVFTSTDSSTAVRDDDVVEITLEPGWNALLVKVTNHADEHGLFARLSQDPLELVRAFDQNEQWDKALAYFDRALEADPDNPSILFSHGRAALKAGQRQVAEASFAKALDSQIERVFGQRTLAGLYYEDAQTLLAAGDTKQAVASFDKARELYNLVLQSGFAMPQDASGLADVIWAENQPNWTVVRPSKATGRAGETLTVEEDGSIFVSGPNPQRAIYTLKLPLEEIGPVSAIRLEALMDPRLPHGGPGRYPDNGNFHLSGFAAAINWWGFFPKSIPIVNAIEDHCVAVNFSAMQAIDGNPYTRWDTSPQWSMPHWAVFAFPSTVQSSEGELVITLDSGISPWGKHGLGRFRLSAASAGWNSRWIAEKRPGDPWSKLGAALRLEAGQSPGSASEPLQLLARIIKSAPNAEARNKLVEQAAREEAVLPALVELQPEVPTLLAAYGRRLASQGEWDAADANFRKARELYERLLQSESAGAEDAAALAEVLLAMSQPKWTVLETTSATSAGVSTLTPLEDGSVLAGGPNPGHDRYTVTADTDLTQVAAIRLEALTDDSLPLQGPGRSGLGAFVLDRFKVTGSPWATADSPTEIDLDAACADFTLANLPIRPGGLWHTHTPGGGGRSHVAVYRLANPLQSQEGYRLTFEMTFKDHGPDGHNLGRFRLSATDDPTAFDTQDRHFAVARIKDLWLRLAAAYAAAGETAQAAERFAKLMDEAPDAEARTLIAEHAIQDQAVLAALVKLSPGNPYLLVAHGRALASQGAWDAAEEAFQQASELEEQALPKWIQTGFWKVGPYPQKLSDAYPPESNPDPFQPVASVAIQGKDLPAELPWQPATVEPDGRIQLGTEVGCNYVLTRVWSAAEQEVALQLGDDDALRALVNGELLLETTPNGGNSRAREHEVPVTLRPGWNTMLLKVRNYDDASSVILAISGDPQDLIAARLGAAKYRAFQLAADGHGEQAVELLSELIVQFPQNDTLYGTRAQIYEKLKQWELAAEDWGQADEVASDKMVRFGNGQKLYLQHRARVHGRLQQWDKQLKDWNVLLESRPLHGNLYLIIAHRGETYDHLGEWDKARADFDRAVALSQNSANAQSAALRFRGLHFIQRGQWRAAADDFAARAALLEDAEKAWWVDRDSAVANLAAGDVDSFRRDVQDMDRRIGANPNEEQSLWLLWVHTLAPGTITDANRDRLFDANDSLGDFHRPRNAAAILYRSGRYAEAAEAFAANPGGLEYDYLAAMSAYKAGDESRAVELLRSADQAVVEQSQQDPRAVIPKNQSWEFWAPLLALKHEAKEVIFGARLAEANRALAADPDNAPALAQRGRLAYLMGKEDAALADLDRAIELKTVDALAYATRAALLLARGQTAAARSDLQTSLKLEPTEPAAQKMAELLLAEVGQAIPWTVLKPAERASAGGATLSLLPDGSILAGGLIAEHDLYTVAADTDLTHVAAIRLEALTDDSLPNHGPGRASGGDFVMDRIKVTGSPRATADSPAGIDLDAACTDFVSPDRPIRPGGEWHTVAPGGGGIPHVAVYRLATPLQSREGSHLTFELTFDHGPKWPTLKLGRFRLSVTDDPAAFDREDRRFAIARIEDPWLRLAAAYGAAGETAQAADWFAKLMDEAPDAAAKVQVAEHAIRDEAVLAALVELRPEEVALLIAHGKVLATQGDWDAASAALERAANLDAPALPKWIQTGFWKVGPYPLALATAYPPELNPDPFQPVASVAVKGIDLPAELHWQPAEVQPNGRIELGTEICCNYVLTRVWSAAEQEVALLLGDDDNLRALVNGELLLETTPNRGAAQPGEHAIAATLEPGWNTILLKVRNASEKSNVVLQLSDAPDDLAAARRGARICEADRLVAAGKADEALALLSELIDENPKDDTLYAERAQACQQFKRWEDAVRDWTQALELKPDDLRYLRERAQILDWRLRRLDEALADWNRLVELAPEDSNLWRSRSQCYDSLGQSERAMADINRAVDLSSPGNLWLALRGRGGYLARKGEWKEAAEDFNKAFGTKVDLWARFDVYRSQAVLQLMAGNVDGYRAAIDKLEELAANDANFDKTTELVLAMVAGPVEITPERRDRLLQLLEEKGPKDEDTKRWLTAALHYRAGDFQQAADLFDQAGRAGAVDQLLAAMVQHELGHQDQAKKMFDAIAGWIQRKEAEEEGPAVPANQNWHNWAVYKVLEREAAALIGNKANEQPGEAPSPPDSDAASASQSEGNQDD